MRRVNSVCKSDIVSSGLMAIVRESVVSLYMIENIFATDGHAGIVMNILVHPGYLASMQTNAGG